MNKYIEKSIGKDIGQTAMKLAKRDYKNSIRDALIHEYDEHHNISK